MWGASLVPTKAEAAAVIPSFGGENWDTDVRRKLPRTTQTAGWAQCRAWPSGLSLGAHWSHIRGSCSECVGAPSFTQGPEVCPVSALLSSVLLHPLLHIHRPSEALGIHAQAVRDWKPLLWAAVRATTCAYIPVPWSPSGWVELHLGD